MSVKPTIVICCHNQDDFILESLSSINLYNPNSEIIIVDSNSPKKEYLDVAKSFYKAKIIEQNSNYELGAWRLATNTFERESYLFLQDSMIQINSLTPDMLNSQFLVVEGIRHWAGASESVIRIVTDIASQAGIQIDKDFYGICGSMMLIKNTLWRELDKCIINFLPTNKAESEACERILGVMMTHLGFNPKDYMMQSNAWHRMPLVNMAYAKYFLKIFKDRQ